MNKIKNYILLFIALFSLTGCFKRDNMENVNIYTTVYPIEYITEYLYGYNSKIDSIYPAETDISSYKLTNKQIKNYASNGSMFIYNGLTSERSIARDLLNANNNLKIIDVSQGLEYEYDTVELWLNPSDYLMVAHNIKNGLEDYISNKYIIEEIDDNYEELKVLISGYDAELELMPDNSENKTIIIADNSLSFLSKYGFDVINIDSSSGTVPSSTISKVKKLLENKKVSYIFTLDTTSETDVTKDLVSSGFEIKKLNSMTILSENDITNEKNYKTMMRDNIDALKDEVYK